MKNILFVVLVMLCACTNINNKTVAPNVVVASFSKKFPTAENVVWEKENGIQYEAGFKLSGKNVSAVFNANGSWLETETDIDASALPTAVANAITANYNNYTLNETCKVESAETGVGYEAELEADGNRMDVLFSEDGKVLKTTQLSNKEDKR